MENTFLVEVRVARQSTSSNQHELDRLSLELHEMGFVVVQSPLSEYGEVVKLSVACAANAEFVGMLVPTLERYNRVTGNSGLLIRFYSVSITSPNENICLGAASDKSQPLEHLENTITWLIEMARENPPPLENW